MAQGSGRAMIQLEWFSSAELFGLSDCLPRKCFGAQLD
jgi:hypothetical protein